MLLWEMIARDSSSLLNTREGTLRWLRKHAPGLWLQTTDGAGSKVHHVRIHEWGFGPRAWDRFHKGVQAVAAIEKAHAKDKPIPAQARSTADMYFARHLRHRMDESGNKLVPYFVRQGRGPRGVEVLSEVSQGRFDSPDVLMAYAIASILDPNVVVLGGAGRCPRCGCVIGTTNTGKARAALCNRCKVAQWREKNREAARRRNRTDNKKYRSKKAKKATQTTTKEKEL